MTQTVSLYERPGGLDAIWHRRGDRLGRHVGGAARQAADSAADVLEVILARMAVPGLGWCGPRTEHDEQLAHLHEHVLGLTPVRAEPGLRVVALGDGRHVSRRESCHRPKGHKRGIKGTDPNTGWRPGEGRSSRGPPPSVVARLLDLDSGLDASGSVQDRWRR